MEFSENLIHHQLLEASKMSGEEQISDELKCLVTLILIVACIPLAAFVIITLWLLDQKATASSSMESRLRREWHFNAIFIWRIMVDYLMLLVSVCLSVFLSVCLSTYLPLSLYVFLSVCLSFCLLTFFSQSKYFITITCFLSQLSYHQFPVTRFHQFPHPQFI